MTTTRQLWESILTQGYDLDIISVKNKSINPFAILAAIADVESEFGHKIKKRYEKNFAPGGKLFQKESYDFFGKDCCYTWGAWQIIGTELFQLGLESLHRIENNFDIACTYAVLFMNKKIEYATNLNDIADMYHKINHGDNEVCFDYIRLISESYAVRLGQVQKYYITGDPSIFND
jgi:hypothetical protein